MLLGYGIILAVFVEIALGNKVIEPPEKCKRSWKKIGCYHDSIEPNRPLPVQLVNHRDILSKVSDMHIFKWERFPQGLHALACRCAELAREKGYLYFGLQFYGECWSGKESGRFYRDGISNKCIGNNYRPCDNEAESECVGKASTNYIYQLNPDDGDEVDGGWSEWSQWNECSSTCGGGERVRKRTCTNPAPSKKGRICIGDSTQSSLCNTEKCQPACKLRLEIGVIIDGSSSVTSQNYEKMKNFIVKLTEEFDVNTDGVHFGMIQFAWEPILHFTTKDKRYWNHDALKKKIMSNVYEMGGTRTDLALYMANEKLFCNGCVRNIPKVLIVITDGRASDSSDSMTIATKELKEKRVTIISMGVGNRIDQAELEEMATDKNHSFLIEDFDYLIDRLNALLKLSCHYVKK